MTDEYLTRMASGSILDALANSQGICRKPATETTELESDASLRQRVLEEMKRQQARVMAEFHVKLRQIKKRYVEER